MSFCFDFGDEGECTPATPVTKEEITSALDTVEVTVAVAPKSHTFAELLQSCLDKHIAYEPVEVTSDCALYRRALFDVRHQLMFEDDRLSASSSNNGSNDEEMKILLGETGEDLRNGVYEGGMKSWECSFDLAEYLKKTGAIRQLAGQERSAIIEIGCGTALPTLYALEQLYDLPMDSAGKKNKKKVSIVLTDFNYDVLRLVSVPNVFLSWANRFAGERYPETFARPGEVLCTRELIDGCVAWFEENGIEITCVSGTWGRHFVNIVDDIVGKEATRLVLTSETIYAPEVLPVLCEVVCTLMHSFSDTNGNHAVIAAKDIYFGVGGTVAEAERVLAALCHSTDLSLRREVAAPGHSGSVQRSLLVLGAIGNV